MAEWPVERDGYDLERYVELCRDNAVTDPAIYHKIDTPFCEVPEGHKYHPVITQTTLGEPFGLEQ